MSEDGPNISDRLFHQKISLNGLSSRVVWPISSRPNHKNNSKNGAITTQGFSFDYLVPRNKAEHGCTEDCHGQMTTLCSSEDAPNCSRWCISPDRITVLFIGEHANMLTDNTEQDAKSEALFSIYIHESSAHSTPAFELPAYHSMGFGTKVCFETFIWSNCGRLVLNVAHKLQQQWFKLLNVASSNMRQLVCWTT